MMRMHTCVRTRAIASSSRNSRNWRVWVPGRSLCWRMTSVMASMSSGSSLSAWSFRATPASISWSQSRPSTVSIPDSTRPMSRSRSATGRPGSANSTGTMTAFCGACGVGALTVSAIDFNAALSCASVRAAKFTSPSRSISRTIALRIAFNAFAFAACVPCRRRPPILAVVPNGGGSASRRKPASSPGAKLVKNSGWASRRAMTPRVFTRTRLSSCKKSWRASTPVPSKGAMDFERSSASFARLTDGARSRAEMREPPLIRDVVMVGSFHGR